MAATIIPFPHQRRAEDEFVRLVRTDDEHVCLRHNSDEELRRFYRNVSDTLARYRATRAKK